MMTVMMMVMMMMMMMILFDAGIRGKLGSRNSAISILQFAFRSQIRTPSPRGVAQADRHEGRTYRLPALR